MAAAGNKVLTLSVVATAALTQYRAVTAGALHCIARAKRRDCRTRFPSRSDGPPNHGVGHEWPGRIMNDDDVSTMGDACKRVRNRITTSFTAFDDRHGFRSAQ